MYQEICEVFAQTLKKFNIGFTRLPIEELNDKIKGERRLFYQSVISDCYESAKTFDSLNLKYIEKIVLKFICLRTFSIIFRTANGFVGLTTMGTMMSFESLKNAIKKAFLKSEIVELMVHPGYPNINSIGGCDNIDGPDEFSKSTDRLHELNELRSDKLFDFYTENNIKLISFLDLKSLT